MYKTTIFILTVLIRIAFFKSVSLLNPHQTESATAFLQYEWAELTVHILACSRKPLSSYMHILQL